MEEIKTLWKCENCLNTKEKVGRLKRINHNYFFAEPFKCECGKKDFKLIEIEEYISLTPIQKKYKY
jgi:hypothetical protein